ncbi:hypothetical protein [Rubrivirga sp.]|uniref:hypothetical protein n=1 Tax=Rubrivirga sp. TaxID=1885344 RepID=UPI003B528C53
MDRATVLLPFVGIIVGLGLADLLLSLHRTVRARRRWHWLPAFWTGLTFLLVLMYWWVFSEIVTSPVLGSFGRFAFHLGSPVLLFLLCAAALPDDVGDGEDLRTYYFANHRYFFGLMAASGVHGALDYGFNYGSWGYPVPWIALVVAGLATTLAMTRRPAVHVVVSGLIAALLVFLIGSFTRTF